MLAPLLAAVLLFLAAVVAAFGYLRLEEVGREQEAVRRDVEYAQQRLRLRLLERQEQLMRLARDISNGDWIRMSSWRAPNRWWCSTPSCRPDLDRRQPRIIRQPGAAQPRRRPTCGMPAKAQAWRHRNHLRPGARPAAAGVCPAGWPGTTTYAAAAPAHPLTDQGRFSA